MAKRHCNPICPKCKSDNIQHQCVECGESFGIDIFEEKATLNITEKSLKELKRLHAAAAPKSIFMFQGKQILREYATYLIQYVESQLNERK